MVQQTTQRRATEAVEQALGDDHEVGRVSTTDRGATPTHHVRVSGFTSVTRRKLREDDTVRVGGVFPEDEDWLTVQITVIL